MRKTLPNISLSNGELANAQVKAFAYIMCANYVAIVFHILSFERLAFYAMCGKYRTIGNSAQANILPHVA
jgi:hypothetical protein